jgi:hypothetical protein
VIGPWLKAAQQDVKFYREKLAKCEVERDEARRVLQISREACEEALHVLTPVRPVMDGLDRTRLALCEAIAAIRKAVGLDKEQS